MRSEDVLHYFKGGVLFECSLKFIYHLVWDSFSFIVFIIAGCSLRNHPVKLEYMPIKNKYFSIEEANTLIPKLLIDIPRIQCLMKSLVSEYPDVRKAREKAQLNGGSLQGAGYVNCVLQINFLMDELAAKGCILKGIEHGLVDFPSLRDGKEVYLCWKNPEQRIEYWHDTLSGFAGRQRI